MSTKQKIIIAVIGGHNIEHNVEQIAHNIGEIVAKVGAILVCGGLDGTMEAAARGCKEAGGTTIGLLPGISKADANPYIDIALPTTIGFARNAMVACSADIIVALPGSHGTSCEISYGLIYGRTIIDLGNWNREGMVRVKDLQEAEFKIKELVAQIQRKGTGKKSRKLSYETADPD
ncbi:MAG: TIGR00725 family protein [Candidatus Omnitrophica bacterium]|nr:TIGR00725 family protein [Candidatus Omnitrophota bacterium]